MPDRLELKYLISYDTRQGLLEAWRSYLTAAPHTDRRAVYPILSLYLDSPSLRFYDEKIDGEALRNKVRLRGYGYRWKEIDSCFLEVKRKVSSRIIKLRKNVGRFRPELLAPETWQLDGDPDLRHLGFLMERHRLRPSVQVFYLREAYESPFSERLRITIDSNLIALHPGEPLTRETLLSQDSRCLRDTDFILEIKCNGALPAWVAAGIQTFQLQQRALSKYVVCVEKLNLQQREIGVYAWARRKARGARPGVPRGVPLTRRN